jgi:hypothetical protein
MFWTGTRVSIGVQVTRFNVKNTHEFLVPSCDLLCGRARRHTEDRIRLTGRVNDALIRRRHYSSGRGKSSLSL